MAELYRKGLRPSLLFPAKLRITLRSSKRLQTEFNLLSSRQVESQLLRNRSEFYEHGEKAGKLLANQLRGVRAKQLIAGVQTEGL